MRRPLVGLRLQVGGEGCENLFPKFAGGVLLEKVADSRGQKIGRHRNFTVRIVRTDDFQRGGVVLHAGQCFGLVDRGLDRFEVIVTDLEGLELRGGRGLIALSQVRLNVVSRPC